MKRGAGFINYSRANLVDQSLEILLDNIKRFFNGDELQNRIDFEQHY